MVNNVEAVRRYRLKHPERVKASARKSYRKWALKAKFNLTQEDFNAFLLEQNGKCAICGHLPLGIDRYTSGKALAVDHDHSTGKVRGLLCDLCNRAMGQFHDSVAILASAIAYLEKYNATS